MAASSYHDRIHYFTPSDVPGELSRGTRSCVPACCAFLGVRPPYPAHPSYSKILKRFSPEGCEILTFDNLKELKPEHLDYLYVATINKNNPGGNGHAAVMYRGEDQMGSTKCHLFNPGNHSPYGQIDLNGKRGIDKWNYICAAFIPGANIPGANIPVKDKKEIMVLDSSDEDEGDPLMRSPTSNTATAVPVSPSSPRVSSPTMKRCGNTQHPRHSRGDMDGGIPSQISPSPRRNPSRVTKMCGMPTPSLFYKESLKVIPARQVYSRVTYTYNDQFEAKQCSKEMIGQHIAKYLLSRGDWVVWFHHDSSQFVIARKENFDRYEIEGAEEGESKFTGYGALAEWAFDSEDNIYQKSLESADGKAFLNGIDCDKDDLDRLFYPNISTAQKRRKKRYLTYNDGSASRKTTSRKKKRHDDEAEQHVADFVFEGDFNANEAFASEAAAGTKDQSPVEDESGKSSEEEIRYSDHESTSNNNGYDDDKEWEWTDEEEAEKQAEESSVDSEVGLKPKSKQVFTKAASRGSSQDNGEDDDVSGLDDDASDEKEDPKAKNDTKRQSEAELKAKNNEPEGNVIKDRREEDLVSDQEEHRHRRGEIEEKEGGSLRRERSAATSTAQELNPDYIVELRDICNKRMMYGSEEQCKKRALFLVCKALDDRDKKTIGLVRLSLDMRKSPEEVVNGLVNIKVLEIET